MPQYKEAPSGFNTIKGLEQLAEARDQLPVHRKTKQQKPQDDYQRTIDTLLTLWTTCMEEYDTLPRRTQNAVKAVTRQMKRYQKHPASESQEMKEWTEVRAADGQSVYAMREPAEEPGCHRNTVALHPGTVETPALLDAMNDALWWSWAESHAIRRGVGEPPCTEWRDPPSED